MTPESQKFALDPSLQVLLEDLGVSPQDLLRQAHLPLDLFSQPSPTLTTAEYLQLWQGVEVHCCPAIRPFRCESPRRLPSKPLVPPFLPVHLQ
jgi:hypothetical protein